MYDSSGGDNKSRLDECVKILNIIDDSLEMLNQWEINFITELQDRIETYGDKTLISPRQLFKLRDIKDKIL